MKTDTPYDNLFAAKEESYKLGGLPEHTHAILRIYHHDLVPDELTRLFSVTPSDFQVRGEPFAKRPKYTAKIGGWFLTTKDRCQSLDYSVHVEWLLDQVAHCRGAIRTLQDNGYRMDVSIKVDFHNCNPTPGLSVSAMRRLVAFDLHCWFDVYVFSSNV